MRYTRNDQLIPTESKIKHLNVVKLDERSLIKNTYKRKYNTMAHQVLDLESAVAPIPDDYFQLLDTLIDEAGKRISVKEPSNREQAKQALADIETVLLQHNFVCSIPVFLVDNLRSALSASPLDPNVTVFEENQARLPHIKKHANEPFHYADCDIYSLIYVSIGQALGLPIVMVAVPKHNFVRWKLNDYEYINWETNYGTDKYSDEDYQYCRHLRFTRFKVQLSTIINGYYLADMNLNAVYGYFLCTRSPDLQRQNQFGRLYEDYINALLNAPHDLMVLNNAAWFYATSKEMATYNVSEKAIAFASKAVSAVRDANTLDTLATAYAAAGNFDEAVNIEKEAYSLESNPSYAHMIKVFGQHKSYVDHEQDKDNAYKEIAVADADGVSNSELLKKLNIEDSELQVIVEGLLLDNKIKTKTVDGEVYYMSINSLTLVRSTSPRVGMGMFDDKKLNIATIGAAPAPAI